MDTIENRARLLISLAFFVEAILSVPIGGEEMSYGVAKVMKRSPGGDDPISALVGPLVGTVGGLLEPLGSVLGDVGGTVAMGIVGCGLRGAYCGNDPAVNQLLISLAFFVEAILSVPIGGEEMSYGVAKVMKRSPQLGTVLGPLISATTGLVDPLLTATTGLVDPLLTATTGLVDPLVTGLGSTVGSLLSILK
uniref:Uncharacterized protein n=1 Tax=Rhodnius prolixus TaxID=13249 RepID=T1HPY9_RHOPR